tara:strand:+ start:527 stop:1420 length:894 start_codon:yes stop_codon:yes gene_type:complete
MDSNFYLQTPKAHFFDDFDLSCISSDAVREIFTVFKTNMEEAREVVAMSFVLMLHSEVDIITQQMHVRSLLDTQINALKGGYEDDDERKYNEAKDLTSSTFKQYEGQKIVEAVAQKLNTLEENSSVKESNLASLRQSIVIIWSAVESLVRDLIRYKLNSDFKLADNFFQSNETAPYWKKNHITYELLLEYDFNISENLGDIAFQLNSCNGLNTILTVCRFVFGNDHLSVRLLKDDDFYSLYKLRNLIAHKNGYVDEKYAQEVSGDFKVGERIEILPKDFSKCFLTAKEFASSLITEF